MCILLQRPPCLHHIPKFLADRPSLMVVHISPSLLQSLALNQGHVDKPLTPILRPTKDFGDRYSALQFLAYHYLSLSFDNSYISSILDKQS